MTENKNGKFSLGIFVGILIALVIGMGVFIIYDKFVKDNNVNNSENQNTTQNNNENSVVTELSISDSLVQELYSSIMFNYYNEYYYHNNSKILANNLDNNIKMYLAVNNWLKEYRDNPNSDVIELNSETGLLVPEEQIKDFYYKMFGKDAVYSRNSSYDFCPVMSYEKDGKIKLLLGCGGYVGPLPIAQNIIKAEKTQNEIHIYEKVAFLDFVMENEERRFNLYKDTEKTNLVAEKVTLNSYTTGNYNELEQYQDKLDTYKYTFKSNGDGTYYFYSVERQ